MTLDNDKARELFNVARNLSSEDREPLLDKECGEDDALRVEVDALLKHYDFTSAQTENSGEEISHTVDYEPGDSINQFKIIGVLGEGGMGIVYLAEQSKPVKRRVALKVIKAGMDTKQVIARFEAERQALAMMNHPGIAQVYEAGTTEEGRPYFVLEFVKGVPITEACDEHKLDTKQRLELLAKVCDAVQHAHQKGIIHRDLKPSNILVLLGEDDVLEPKIIDFGVAKATNQQLTDKTLITLVGRFIGTPAYMSPEQADLKATDIDTRTDVYALGVVTYEVLTGFPPFDPHTLRDAGLEKMREIIRTQPPPKPSTQLSSIDDEDATKIADTHQVQIASLVGMLRKELEWIPLKALRKRRSERYDSPKSMADDIRRYLKGEALEAGPEKFLYRAKKKIRRNKGLLVAATIIGLVLLSGIATTGWQWREAEIEKGRAIAIKEFLSDMFLGLEVEEVEGLDTELVLKALDRTIQNLESNTAVDSKTKIEIYNSISTNYHTFGKLEKSNELIGKVMELLKMEFGDEHPDTLSSMYWMGRNLHEQGKYDEAEVYFVEGLEIRRRVLGDEHPDTLSSMYLMGRNLEEQGKYDEAEVYFLERLETNRRVFGDDHSDTLSSMHWMGRNLHEQGKYDEAEVYFVEGLEIQRRVLGDEHSRTLITINWMGRNLYEQGKYDEAEVYFVEELDIQRRVLGDEDSRTLSSMHSMGRNLHEQGKYDEAGVYFVEELEIQRRVLGDDHSDTLITKIWLAVNLHEQGKYDEAEVYFVEGLEIQRRVLGDEHSRTLSWMYWMGRNLYEQGKYDEAEVYFVEGLEIQRRVLGDEDSRTLMTMIWLALNLYEQGKYDEAEVYFVEGLEIQRRVLGDEHSRTLSWMYWMGRNLYEQGKYDEAEVYFVEGLEIQRRVLGDEHSRTLRMIKSLIQLYDAWGKLEEAEKYRDMLPEEKTDDSE